MATRRSGGPSLSLALLLLRAAAGGALLVHGLQKLLVTTPGAFVAGVGAQGLPVPQLLGWLVIAGEVGLGALLLVGLVTRPAAGLAALLTGLVWLTQHLLPRGFVADGDGGVEGEPAFLLLAMTLALAATGPGRFALDGTRATRGGGVT